MSVVAELRNVLRRERAAFMRPPTTPKACAAAECMEITVELIDSKEPMDVVLCKDGSTILASMCRVPINDKVQYHLCISKHAAGFANVKAANMFSFMHSFACSDSDRPYFCSRPIDTAYKMFNEVMKDNITTLYVPETANMQAEADFCGVSLAELNRRTCEIESGYAVAVKVSDELRSWHLQCPYELSIVKVG